MKVPTISGDKLYTIKSVTHADGDGWIRIFLKDFKNNTPSFTNGTTYNIEMFKGNNSNTFQPTLEALSKPGNISGGIYLQINIHLYMQEGTGWYALLHTANTHKLKALYDNGYRNVSIPYLNNKLLVIKEMKDAPWDGYYHLEFTEKGNVIGLSGEEYQTNRFKIDQNIDMFVFKSVDPTPCSIYNPYTERIYNVRHHRSDNYDGLIWYNRGDGNAFRNATAEGWKYAKIPKFSGDTLYTINTSAFGTRTDFFNGSFRNYETNEKPALEYENNYTIYAYKECS